MTTIRITDPLDLVTIVPYQLGYHPGRSMVVVGLLGRRVQVVQRSDLPPPGQGDTAADLVARHIVTSGCDSAVLVVYEDRPGEGTAVAEAVADLLTGAGVHLLGHVVVRDGYAFFPGRPDEETGIRLPSDDQVPAVADFVALGRAPLGARADLAGLVAAEPDALSRRVAAARARTPTVDHPRAARGWGQLLDVADGRWFAPEIPGAPTLAAMLVGLTDPRLRDLVIAWLTPGTLPAQAFDAHLLRLLEHFPAPPRRAGGRRGPRRGSARPDGADGTGRLGWQLDGGAQLEREQRLVTRLAWLARHAPPPDRAGALTVLGNYAWHIGDGTMARVAVEAALDADPGYRLALLVLQLVELGVRPSQLRPAPRHAAG